MFRKGCSPICWRGLPNAVLTPIYWHLETGDWELSLDQPCYLVCYAEAGRLAETLRAMRVKATAATRMKAA